MSLAPVSCIIFARYPDSLTSKSTTALSVSIDAIPSPGLNSSPSLIFHSTIVPLLRYINNLHIKIYNK